MSSRLSSPALRTIIVDLPAELSSYNSAELPDGATIYLNDTNTLYRLDKTAGTALDSLISSGYVVQPDDQTDARWILESSAGSNPYYHSSYVNGPLAVTLTSGQWGYLGNVAGSFAVSAGSGAVFAISNTTGEVTYHGPTREVAVTAKFSLLNGSSSTAIIVHACLSRDDDVAAGVSTVYASKGEQEAQFANVPYEMSVTRIMSLSEGTRIRLGFRNETNGDDVSVVFYQLAVTSP